MERRGSPIPREQRLFQDRLPEEFLHPDLNPYLKLHRGWGRPVLTADEAAECRGGWHEEFGREAALHVEIGTGNGFFLSGMAAQHPEWNWLGVEIRYKRVVLTARKLRGAGVQDHARICRYDANHLGELFCPGDIAALYINHPDPWPKERQAKNRLLGTEFVHLLEDLLAPGAELRLKTDHLINVEGLSKAIEGRPFSLVGRSDDVQARGTPWVDDVVTNYQRKFYEKGLPVYAVWLRRMPGTPP